MKTYLAILLLAVACVTGYSQTNAPAVSPSNTWLDAFAHSNMVYLPYGVYSTTTHSFGGGIGIGYHVTDAGPVQIVPLSRFEAYHGSGWAISGGLQLQVPFQVTKGVWLTPYTSTGVMLPMNTGTTADDNGIALLGAGVSLHLDRIQRLSLLLGYEHLYNISDNRLLLGVSLSL